MSKIEVWVKGTTQPTKTGSLYYIKYTDGKNKYSQTAFFNEESGLWLKDYGDYGAIPWQETIEWLDTEAITTLEQDNARMREGLEGLLSLGRKDLSNPKYDAYFQTATDALNH